MKYTDKDGKEHGAYTCTYDMDALRFELGKREILRSEWLYISRVGGRASVNVHIAHDAARSIVYGINTDEPDRVCRVRPGSSEIASMRSGRLDYVSAYIIFADGTSSGVRRAK